VVAVMIEGGKCSSVVYWTLCSLWLRQCCFSDADKSQRSAASGRDCSVRVFYFVFRHIRKVVLFRFL